MEGCSYWGKITLNCVVEIKGKFALGLVRARKVAGVRVIGGRLYV